MILILYICFLAACAAFGSGIALVQQKRGWSFIWMTFIFAIAGIILIPMVIGAQIAANDARLDKLVAALDALTRRVQENHDYLSRRIPDKYIKFKEIIS